MVDDEGEVVWYHVEDHPVGEVTLLDGASRAAVNVANTGDRPGSTVVFAFAAAPGGGASGSGSTRSCSGRSAS